MTPASEQVFRTKAAESLEAVIEQGARRMMVEQWRIGKVLLNTARWPTGYSLNELLAVAHKKEADYTRLGLDGHWTFDANLLIAVMQARRALTRMIEAAAVAENEGRN